MGGTSERRILVIEGRALPLRGDDIDTDRIIPARFLRAVRFEGLEAHVFEDDRRALEGRGTPHPFSNPAYDQATILLVNGNFGCGSSREHAPQALSRRGIDAIVGESFSEIFFGNAAMIGLPCFGAPRQTMEALMGEAERDPTAVFKVSVPALTCTAGGRTFPLTLPAAAQEAFLRGVWDPTALLLDNPDEVRAVADSLPYISAR